MYVAMSKNITGDSDINRLPVSRLLVCGPTNKSVSVLARKFLSCVRDEGSVKVALIGEESELLSDNDPKLESRFVYTYPRRLARSLEQEKKHLSRSKDLDLFHELTSSIISSMKRDIPGVSRYSLEQAFEAVKEMMLCHDTESSELLRAISNAVKEIKNLDQQEVGAYSML